MYVCFWIFWVDFIVLFFFFFFYSCHYVTGFVTSRRKAAGQTRTGFGFFWPVCRLHGELWRLWKLQQKEWKQKTKQKKNAKQNKKPILYRFATLPTSSNAQRCVEFKGLFLMCSINSKHRLTAFLRLPFEAVYELWMMSPFLSRSLKRKKWDTLYVFDSRGLIFQGAKIYITVRVFSSPPRSSCNLLLLRRGWCF